MAKDPDSHIVAAAAGAVVAALFAGQARAIRAFLPPSLHGLLSSDALRLSSVVGRAAAEAMMATWSQRLAASASQDPSVISALAKLAEKRFPEIKGMSENPERPPDVAGPA